MASKAFNISLPEKWSELVAEISDLTGESMASIIQRAAASQLISGLCFQDLAQLVCARPSV